MNSQNSLPSVTIIMPIRNESEFIGDSLLAALSQDYPVELLEVVLVDGESTDSTREIVSEVINNRQSIIGMETPSVSVFNNQGIIVPTAMNMGISHAKGKIIIRVDGHTVIAHNYVRECVRALEQSGADNVGGRMSARGETSFGMAVAIATASPFGIGGSRFHYSDREEWVDTVYMGAWPQETFNKFGVFDEELIRNQDDEFNYRIIANGGRILLTPRIQSSYKVRSTPKTLWRQYFQYGYWKIRVLQKHPRQMRVHQFVPFLFTSSLMLGIPLAIISIPKLYVLAIIAGAYLIANLVASLWLAFRKGWKYIIVLPLIFAILHFSYGFGFQAGLVRFYNRWRDRIGAVPSRLSTNVTKT